MRDTRLLDYHRAMLTDTVRMDAFRRALAEAVSEGDVVVDVGCGTGVLAFFACEAGARHVYAIEQGPVIHLARDLARQNGLADRVTFIQGRSAAVDVPEAADVIVSETLWNFGLGEGILATVGDAATRWLKPGGAIVPESFEMFLAPVASGPEEWFSGFEGADFGLDFSRLRVAWLNTVHRFRPDPSLLLGAFTPVGRIRLPHEGPDRIELTGSLLVETAGRLDCLMGGFRSHLWGGVEVSSLPPTVARSWATGVFPLGQEVEVEPGDLVAVRLTTYAHDETTWTWAWRVERAGEVVAEARQSTVRSLFRVGALGA